MLLKEIYHRLKTIFRRTPAHFQGKDIEFAFTSGGIDYYQFKGSGFSLYYDRYAAAVDFFWAVEYHRISDTQFDGFQDAIDAAANQNDIAEIVRLNQAVRALRQMAYSLPLLYNLCSVWFFDKSENPYAFDREYAWVKIKRWEKDKNTLAFFLSRPIADYMPLAHIIQESSQRYMQASAETQLAFCQRILSNLSLTEKESDTVKNLKREMDLLKQLIDSAA